jgi:putative transposase
MSSVSLEERLAQMGQDLREQFSQGRDLTQDFFGRAGRLVIEALLGAEVSQTLGREAHQRREGPQRGYRNGYKTRQCKTGEGRIEVDLPQVRGLEQPYRSVLWQGLGRRSVNLDKLVQEMYVRGLSTRDIEDLLKEIGPQPPQALDGQGPPPLLSKSAVSEVTEALWAEYEAFAKRDLSGFDVVYLFVDAVYESLRQQAGVKDAILVSWGICANGSKVLLHLSQGGKESQDAWLEHFRSLVSRGLPAPLTVTSDGAPGCIAAIEAMWPESERIRCWVHKMKNILEKVPAERHEPIKRLLLDLRDAPDHATGKQRAAAVIEQYREELPSAMACLEDDLEASLAHLKLPSLHQKTVRTTNLAERGFVEERRRAKVIPRFRSERECLKLVFGTLWRASERWRKVKFTAFEQKQLEAYIRVRQAMGKKVRDLKVAA